MILASLLSRVLAFGLLSSSAEALIKLGRLNISKTTITTGGVSAGGYMAVQMHVAHSNIIKGAAVFAGGPWYCAEGSITIAEEKCMDYLLGGPNLRQLVDLTLTNAAVGLLDDPFQMRSHRVYLFGGEDDTVIDPGVVQTLESYYKSFMPASNIMGNYHLKAEHCMPTLDFGEDCDTLSSPYIGNCDFDGAGEALTHIYGKTLVRGVPKLANLFEFDQTPYIKLGRESLDKVGFIYIPTACQDGKTECKLHISFHGCLQNRDLIENEYAVFAGYNPWAEANNIVVLYPYVIQSQVDPFNPNGCWDWWGYTDKVYPLKTGMQIKFVRELISTLVGI